MDSSDYSSGKINVSFLPPEADEVISIQRSQ